MRTDDNFVDKLRSLAKIDSVEVVRDSLADVRVEDIAEDLPRLELEESVRLLQRLEAQKAAEILVEVPTETARRYVAALPDATLAHYLDILPMDDALELRDDLPPDRFEALLQIIPREDADEIRRLLSYPEDSAGQRMTEKFVSALPEETVGQILRRIREAPEDRYEMINTIYVLDRRKHLLGVLNIKRLVRSDPELPVRAVMSEDVVSVPTHMHEEEAARLLARYGFYSIPVLDERGRVVGIMTADDAQEILEEADTEDVLSVGAVVGDAENYLSLGVAQLAKRRVPWLLALFVAETFTGMVLRHYGQGSGGLKLDPITFFIPLLIGAGGNSGAQVTTTITRALALGEVTHRDWLTIIRKEFVTALLVGAMLGMAGYLRALLWGTSMELSLVVGIALPAIVLWAATVGSLLPLGAKRLRIDPAVMSAPFITTLVDATGLIIYFEIASWLRV